MLRRESGELKNTTLTPLTHIGVDAHDGVHIFRVIARLGAVNRSVSAASQPWENAALIDATRASGEFLRGYVQ